MNTNSVDCRRIKELPLKDGQHTQPGDFGWSFDMPWNDSNTIYLYIHLPGDARGWSAIQVQRGQAGGSRVWGWDGNEDHPTITPSINAVGQWHGWLKAGKLISV